MVEYIQVLNGLTSLLNKRGRGVKGFNAQEEFKGYLKTLKNDFGQEISTHFLFNLMEDNKVLNKYQKRRRIQNLIKGLDKVKKGFYKRGLELMNYKTEVIEYKHTKKPLNLPSVELSEEEQQQINEIKTIGEKTGVFICGTAEENFKNRVRCRNWIYNKGVVLVSARVEQIGKEFIKSQRKNFNFIVA